jgi:hypothetical protein
MLIYRVINSEDHVTMKIIFKNYIPSKKDVFYAKGAGEK